MSIGHFSIKPIQNEKKIITKKKKTIKTLLRNIFYRFFRFSPKMLPAHLDSSRIHDSEETLQYQAHHDGNPGSSSVDLVKHILTWSSLLSHSCLPQN